MATLGSLNLAVKDLDAAIAFYTGLFDFPELPSHRAEHFRLLDAGGLLLGFNDPSFSARYGGLTSGGLLLSFDVPSRADVERLSDKAVALGATLKQPPHDAFFGAVEAMFTDLDGHTFRILAWTTPPK